MHTLRVAQNVSECWEKNSYDENTFFGLGMIKKNYLKKESPYYRVLEVLRVKSDFWQYFLIQ